MNTISDLLYTPIDLRSWFEANSYNKYLVGSLNLFKTPSQEEIDDRNSREVFLSKFLIERQKYVESVIPAQNIRNHSYTPQMTANRQSAFIEAWGWYPEKEWRKTDSMDMRGFGSISSSSMALETAAHLRYMGRRFSLTRELVMASAIHGQTKVLTQNNDGTWAESVMFDPFEKFGITPNEPIVIDPTTNFDSLEFTTDMKSMIAKAVQGNLTTGFIAICGEEFWRAMLSDNRFRTAVTLPYSTTGQPSRRIVDGVPTEIMGNQDPQPIVLDGIAFYHDFNGYGFASNEAVFFPAGLMGQFIFEPGPCTWVNIGTNVDGIYFEQRVIDDNEGYRTKGQMSGAWANLFPEACFTVTVATAAEPAKMSVHGLDMPAVKMSSATKQSSVKSDEK